MPVKGGCQNCGAPIQPKDKDKPCKCGAWQRR